MPEKFLVIGASSFYGSNFMEFVKRKGDFALPMSLRDWSPMHIIDMQPDYIINFAAANLVAESWDEPSEYCRVNVCEHTDLFDVLKEQKWLKLFIQVSTPEVYGSNNWWVEEDQPFNPTTPYAVSRAAGDMMLKAYHRAYGLPMVITRTANIYGPGQPENRIIPKAIAHKRAGKVLPLHGGGDSIRSFIHVRDACAATYLVAKSGTNGETYHISCRPAYTIRAVVQKIGCKYQVVPDRRGKDHSYLLESEKVRALGWEETISLEEGLKECESSI